MPQNLSQRPQVSELTTDSHSVVQEPEARMRSLQHKVDEDKLDNPDETSKSPAAYLDPGDDSVSLKSDTNLKAEIVGDVSITRDLADLSVSYELRSYKKELLVKIKEAEAEGYNAIVCAPTGSGKTLVAASYCADVIMGARDKAITEEKSRCIYHIVPTVHLVDQPAKFIKISVTNCRVGQISEDQRQTTLCEQTKISGVVVMTPMILVEAMKVKDPQVKVSHVSLIIFDECHHTDKEHPYVQIMDMYFKQKLEAGKARDELPRVLGMTATLGVGSTSTPKDAQNHMLMLCANLDSPEIIQVVKNRDDLYQYVSHPDTQLLSVDKLSMEDQFRLEIKR